ncbi:MAG TPA: monovalent cation/H+ antiporter complex subunit F [Myxococcaceae bacterium]|nr:monovalent cation/H+ antiporter complex subunit F [Myxococcaceae bacterium]
MIVDLLKLLLCVLLFGSVAAGLWRLNRGPTTLDRLLGLDLTTITIMSIVLVFSALTGTVEFIEFVLLFSALGFLTTVSYFYYLMQLPPEDEEFDAGDGR